MPLPSVALPLRFNFPNDPVAAEQFPEELESVVVFHYLREDELNRQQIFRWRETYSHLLTRPLHPANARFRESVRMLLGDDYPFDHIREPRLLERHEQPPPTQSVTPSTASPTLIAEETLLARFHETGALEPLMKAKQSLVARFGVEAGWTRYKELLGLRLRPTFATPRSEDRASTRVGTGHISPRRTQAVPRSESRA